MCEFCHFCGPSITKLNIKNNKMFELKMFDFM